MRVLLVCTGNTCRSPMAEGLLRDAARRRGLKLEVASAGIWASPGDGAAAHTLTVLGDRGIDLSGHKARTVTAELLEHADLVLTMTRQHKESLLWQFPTAAGKVHTLGEYAAGPGEQPADVPDPVGGSLETYRSTAATLEQLLEKVLDRLAAEQQQGGT